MASELDLASHARGQRFNPSTAQIPLSQGKFALIDAADYAYLSQFKWTLYQNGSKTLWYARSAQAMHRMIVNAPPGVPVDHINGDGLDNRRCNLRLATPRLNAQNRCKVPGSKSQYKGVCPTKNGKKWRTQININGKVHHLGEFQDETLAAQTYDFVARQFFGPFARLNFAEAA